MFNKINKREHGFRLEKFACEQLIAQGCSIAETNFQCKLGEIDIIARDGEVLSFIEVRYRKQNTYGGAIASVDMKKQRKIIRTASLYLQQHKLTNKVSCRFDVFAIDGSRDRLAFDWIKNAFTA